MQQHSIRVEDIVIGERHRALSDDACERLSTSMRDIGLRQPISVRIVDEMEVDGDLTAGVPVLVAGRHRLEAAKRLGWSHIDCIEVADDEIQAEMWEIAENLHRLDLTKEQRDQHIRRYAELIEARAALPVDGQNVPKLSIRGRVNEGRPKSIATKIAEETGLSAKTILRALNPPASSVEPPKEIFDVHERARSRLMSAWNGATQADRQWFRDWIDTPIMDQRYG